MICLQAPMVEGQSPAQVAENIRKMLRQLPPSVNGELKLSPEAKKVLGGKKPAHSFVNEVQTLLIQ